ncbi:MAG: hypothetical protein J0I41_23020 [Filimonas sp.]|nr:hypothetical protein [Filimonas sp.]
MKSIILFVSILLATTTSYAKCASSGIWCLSKSNTLNKNGIIILDFYCFSQDIVSKLNSKYPIYLKSSKEKIPLKVIDTLKGEMQLTQVILKATSILKTNEIYTLQIDNTDGSVPLLNRYNDSTKQWETITFRVSNIIDKNAPILAYPSVEQKKTLHAYGCGPAKWVYFSITAQDQSEVFVKATVKNKTTLKTTSYILNIENGMVKIGHGMCSGAFHFDNGDNFEITFQLIDQSGNKGTISKPISFYKPTFSTGEE